MQHSKSSNLCNGCEREEGKPVRDCEEGKKVGHERALNEESGV